MAGPRVGKQEGATAFAACVLENFREPVNELYPERFRIQIGMDVGLNRNLFPAVLASRSARAGSR